jgi:hypothetical protein
VKKTCGALDWTLEHWESAKLLEILERENEIVLNSEIQFSAILGSLTHVLCDFAFRIWSQEKGRTGKGSSLAIFLCMMVNIDSVLLLAHFS